MDGYCIPYRLDRNTNRGGIKISIRETIFNKILEKHIFPNDVESIFVELNFKKCKWLLSGTYNPPSQSDEYFFNNLATLIRLLILIVSMIKFCLWGILTQKFWNSA